MSKSFVSLFCVVSSVMTAFSGLAVAREAAPITPLSEITVMGKSSKSSTLDYIPTVSEISGDRLDRKKQTTLGETLSHETGVSSTQFGPNASRPVIRGLGGERIRVLENGTGVLDASAASEDHAVAQDPLSIERIEIVRGPAALLYGSSAVGGVVNVISNRIPELKSEGLLGKFDIHGSSVDSGSAGALAVDDSFGNFGIHVDGSLRNAQDYKIPGYARTGALRQTPPAEGEDAEGRVLNSGNSTRSGALGASYFFDQGFAGFSYSKYDSNYGTVAEKNVKIKMQQERVGFASELKNWGLFESVKLKSTSSDYKHSEIAAGEIGTTFKNRGHESRLELKHQKLGSFEGFVGLQSNVFEFGALGDEAFLPNTHNQSLAAFIYEEAPVGNWTASAGARMETTSVAGDQFTSIEGTSHTSDKKSFAPASASLGLKYALDPVNAVVLNLASTERAPNYQELYADGPHLATAAYEIGDVNLGTERAQSAELSYRHKSDDLQASFGLFLQDFQNFIALSNTGSTWLNPENGESVGKFQYGGVAARLYGAEFEARHQLPKLIPGGNFEVGVRTDFVRGLNRQSGDNLPRMTPARAALELTYKANRYSLNAEIQRVTAQNNTAAGETSTEAYSLMNAGAEWPVIFDTTTLNLYARASNLLDVEARNHVSFLKDIAPLPGRNFILGVQSSF